MYKANETVEKPPQTTPIKNNHYFLKYPFFPLLFVTLG